MPTQTEFVTMPTIVLDHLMLVAFAMGLVPFTPADVQTFPQAIVIATASVVDAWACGGLAADADADGICDDVDPCVGLLDDCGVCNGDGSSCADPCAAANQASAYTLTVESAPAAPTPVVPFTGSMSMPMMPQTRCLRCLATTKHTW